VSTNPVRLQLSRPKCFDLQALSQVTDGLPAINCARPGKWGGRYEVKRWAEHFGEHVFVRDVAHAEALYLGTKNLKATQRALGHAAVASTLRYLRSDIDDVRQGMEAIAEAAQPGTDTARARLADQSLSL